jgi:hypothetical protein
VLAAWAVGILLPLLETCRRGFGTWRVEATTMLEDYLAGAVLLLAAFAATRAMAYAGRLLLAAWAGVGTMMTISLCSQVEETIRAVDLEPHNGVVLGFKALLWAVSLVALTGSFRAAAR